MIILTLACIAIDPKIEFDSNFFVNSKNLKQEFADARGLAMTRGLKGGKPGPALMTRFATGPGRRKFEFEKLVKMSPGRDSINRYGFIEMDGRNVEVQRTAPSEPYRIRGIGDNDPMRRGYFDLVFGKYLDAPWKFAGYDVGEAVSRGWFVVSDAHEIENQGHRLIQITFRLTTMPVPSYYDITFDPSTHWAITKASAWDKDRSKIEERFEATYGPTSSGKLYMKTLHWWGLDGKERLIDFDQVEFVSTPATEFTLEHYGLKGPPLPAKKSNHKLVIAILTAAVVLLVAAWLVRRHAMLRD